MIYKKIEVAHEFNITGSNNGVYCVAIKDKRSFLNNDEKNYFNDFFKKNNLCRERIFIDRFALVDMKKIHKIILYPTSKKIREIDFLMFSPYKVGLNFLVSDKVLNEMNKFNLPDYNKIPSVVDLFQKKYNLIGFPMISNSQIDIKKSVFFDIENDKKIFFSSYSDYKEVNFNIKPIHLYLLLKYDYDLVNLQGEGMFFSEKLIRKLEENNTIGLNVKNTTLEITT